MYSAIIASGWKTGVHDCRGLTYEHPWLVIHRETETVIGCWSKAEAARILRDLKRGVPPEAVQN